MTEKREKLIESLSCCPLLVLTDKERDNLFELSTTNLDIINDSLTMLFLVLLESKFEPIGNQVRYKAIKFNIISRYDLCDLSK